MWSIWEQSCLHVGISDGDKNKFSLFSLCAQTTQPRKARKIRCCMRALKRGSRDPGYQTLNVLWAVVCRQAVTKAANTKS